MEDKSEREPLASQDVNVTSETQGGSKLQLKPPSKLPVSATKRTTTSMKRKADAEPPNQPEFKKKFDGADAAHKFHPSASFDGRPSNIGLRSSKTNAFLNGRPSSVGTRSATATRNTARPPAGRPTRSTVLPSKTDTGRQNNGLKRSNSKSFLETDSRGVSGPLTSSTRTTAAKKPPVPSAKSLVGGGGGAKKRPAWDLKGRLQDMEESMSQYRSLDDNLRITNERVQVLEGINSQLKQGIQVHVEEKNEVSQERRQLERKLQDLEDSTAAMKRKYTNDLEDIRLAKGIVEREKATLQGEIEAAGQEIIGLKTSIAQMTSAQAGMNAELGAVKIQLEQSQQFGQEREKEIVELKSILAARDARIEEMSDKLTSFESERRKLHNTIQELKGNIRVFCRVRPLLGDELKGNEDGLITHMHFPDDCKMLQLEKLTGGNLNDTATSGNGANGKGYDFSYDRVFAPAASQEQVFEEISQLVQSALDGYNVCIFAYGQTGSGKTYTMEGKSDVDPDTMGMIPRAIQQVFQTSQDLKEKGWAYSLEASFLEIYNETLRDLLGDGKEDVKHDIKLVRANSNEVMVTNLTLVNVTSQQQVHTLLTKASHNRAVAETKCNERSSRSHSVFRMKLTGNNTKTGESCVGTLNLVDLAGSERLKESGSQGARLKETQAINRSLSDLGNVIMALANKDAHVPYRNSKLTHLLQNSLGGNSKTLMFVNVSPREDSFNETLNSLRFATKVNQCNIGTAQKKSK